MPATRRANAKAGGPANRGGQKTLSFGSRSKVTKPAASTQSKSPPNDVAFLEDTSDVKSTTSSTDKPTTAAVESAIKDQVETETVRPRTEEEVQASRLKDSQIRKYWKAVEAERKAPRVHQQDLTMNDKILRHFDLSSHYGPCIGIARTKRWHRANRLNLHPPLEVLSVLLKEDEGHRNKSEMAHMDELLL